MSQRFHRGLVVGKFSPLHKGHECLLDHATDRCDSLLVISWSEPEYPRCGTDARQRWLQRHCPQATVLVLDNATLKAGCERRGVPVRRLPANDSDEESQRRFVAWLCLHWIGGTVDAVFTSETYGDALARTLTACFREREPAHPAVAHVCVDLQRTRVPVSGTLLRGARSPAAFVAAHVLADLVPRIALLGGESSGKTTLARAVAGRLGTVWVPEYGRELWEQVRRTLTADELDQVARTQVAWEEAHAVRARGWLVCDTTPLTTLQYCIHDHGHASAELHALAQRHYDLTVLCEPDFGFVQDGCRRDDTFRRAQHAWTLARLAEQGVLPLMVSGSVEQRVRQVLAHLPPPWPPMPIPQTHPEETT